MVVRIMVREPDYHFNMWKVEVNADIDLINNIILFCEQTFGPYCKSPNQFDKYNDFPWDRINGTRWSMGLIAYLDPPWLEMYFRDKEDVAILKLRFAEYFQNG